MCNSKYIEHKQLDSDLQLCEQYHVDTIFKYLSNISGSFCACISAMPMIITVDIQQVMYNGRLVRIDQLFSLLHIMCDLIVAGKLSAKYVLVQKTLRPYKDRDIQIMLKTEAYYDLDNKQLQVGVVSDIVLEQYKMSVKLDVDHVFAWAIKKITDLKLVDDSVTSIRVRELLNSL